MITHANKHPPWHQKKTKTIYLRLNLTLAPVGISVAKTFHPAKISSCSLKLNPKTSVGSRISYLRTTLARIQILSAIANRWPIQALGPAEKAKTNTHTHTHTTDKKVDQILAVRKRQWMSMYTHRVAICGYPYPWIVQAWTHRHHRPNVSLIKIN